MDPNNPNGNNPSQFPQQAPIPPMQQQPSFPQPQQQPVPQYPPVMGTGSPQDPMSKNSPNEQRLKLAISGGLIIVILSMLSAVIFFDNIKNLFNNSGSSNQNSADTPAPFPTIDPKVVCARFSDINQALQYPDKACILDLTGQDLTSLPGDVSKLTKLNTIILKDNRFTVFPQVLTGINSIVEIDLSENQVAALPDQVADMNQLNIINLAGNPVISNPDEMAKLSEVKSVITQISDEQKSPQQLEEEREQAEAGQVTE